MAAVDETQANCRPVGIGKHHTKDMPHHAGPMYVCNLYECIAFLYNEVFFNTIVTYYLSACNLGLVN